MRQNSRRLTSSARLAAVALGAGAALVACTPSPWSAGSVPASGEATGAAYESRILTLVNAERAKAHLRPLALDSCADDFANAWAKTMGQTGNFAHQSLTPIMTKCGVQRAGENIAYGNVSADTMMQMWMNSPGHRANILNPAYTHIGIGAVKTSSGRWYGVQDFVTR